MPQELNDLVLNKNAADMAEHAVGGGLRGGEAASALASGRALEVPPSPTSIASARDRIFALARDLRAEELARDAGAQGGEKSIANVPGAAAGEAAQSGVPLATFREEVPSDFAEERPGTLGTLDDITSASGSGVVRLPGSAPSRGARRRASSRSGSNAISLPDHSAAFTRAESHSESRPTSDSSGGQVLARARVAVRMVRRSELTPSNPLAAVETEKERAAGSSPDPSPLHGPVMSSETSLANGRPAAQQSDDADLENELNEDGSRRPTGASVLMAWASTAK